MDVQVAHDVDADRFERLKAEENACARCYNRGPKG
jgi:muconolactone delta-isomerase